MAKPGERLAGSNRDVVRRFLVEHDGAHRCTEIAAATGLTSHQVAIAARGLAVEAGEAKRGTRPATNGGRPFQTYEATDKAREVVGASSENDTTNQPPN